MGELPARAADQACVRDGARQHDPRHGPGWAYLRSDLVALIGGEREHRGTVTARTLAFGLVERARNTDYRAGAQPAQPLRLYHLTPAGEAWREERAAFKECGSTRPR
jgi:hypothetical protein